MENSLKQNNDDLNYKLDEPGKIENITTPKAKRKSSLIKKVNKVSSFIPKKLSLMQYNNLINENINVKSAKFSRSSFSYEPGVVSKFEVKKESDKNEKKEGRQKTNKDGVNRNFLRTNEKKVLSQKKKREGNRTYKIRVVGTVSAKLNELIRRLEQNTISNINANNIQYGDKVVIAPRIKAALEKFNRKKEKKTERTNYSDYYKKKNITIEEKDHDELENNEDNENNEEEEEYEYLEEYEEEEENVKDDIKEKQNIDKEINPLNRRTSVKRRSVKIRKSKKEPEKSNNVTLEKQKPINGKEDEPNNSEDEEIYDEKGKIMEKRRRQAKNSRDNSKNHSSKESEDEDNEQEEENSLNNSNNSFTQGQIFRGKIKKYIAFSENSDESDYKNNTINGKNSENNSDNEINTLQRIRAMSNHRSGRGIIILNENQDKNSMDDNEYNINNNNLNSSILSEQNPINVIQEINNNDRGKYYFIKEYNSNADKSKRKNSDTGNIISIKKRFSKNIEFEKFLFKSYAITNYNSKSNGRKNIKEMLKYIPSKEINFSLTSVNDEKIIKVYDVSNILKKYKQTNNEGDDSSVTYQFNSSIQKYKNKENIMDDNSQNYKNINLLEKYKNIYSSNSRYLQNPIQKDNEMDDDIKVYKNKGLSKKYKNNENTDEYKIIKNSDLMLNYIKDGNEDIIENDKCTNPVCFLKKYQNNSISDNNNINNLGNYKNTISLNNEVNDNNTIIDKESIGVKNYIKNYKNIEDDDADSEIYYKNAGAFKKYKKNDVNNDQNDNSNESYKISKNAQIIRKYNNNIENDCSSTNYKFTTSIKGYKANINDNEENIKSYKTNNATLRKNDNNEDEENTTSFKTRNNSLKKYYNINNDDSTKNSKIYSNVNLIKSYYNRTNDIDDSINKVIANSIKYYSPKKNNNNNTSKEPLNSISRKDYNINHFQIKLSNIEKMKADLLNENITINKEINKRRRSIVLTKSQEILDISNKLNEKEKYNNGILKNKGKNENIKSIRKKRISIFEIAKMKGIAGNIMYNNENYENMNTDSEKTKNVKSNLFKMKKKYNDNEEENVDNIKIGKTIDNVKYISFNFANIKKMYKKEKWILAPCKDISIFLKSRTPNNVDKKKCKKNVNFNNVDDEQKYNKIINDLLIKNKTTFENINRVQGDNQKILKNKKFLGDIKKYVNNEEYKEIEEIKENNNINKISNNNNISSNGNFGYYGNYKVYFDLLFNVGKGKKKGKTVEFKNAKSDSENNDTKVKDIFKRKEKRISTVDQSKCLPNGKNPLNNYYELKLENEFKRKYKREFTVEGRTLFDLNDLPILEENNKGIRRIVYKKAKIKKFKSCEDYSDPYPNKRRKKVIVCKHSSDKNTECSKNENSNGKLKGHSYTRRVTKNKNLKNTIKKYFDENSSYKSSDNEENSTPNSNNSSIDRSHNKMTIKKNMKNKSQIKELNDRNPLFSLDNKINININKNNQKEMQKLNTTQNKVNQKLKSKELTKKKHFLSKNPSNKIKVISDGGEDEKYKTKIKPPEMAGVEAIKSRLKIKLIELNDNLLDAIHYYNGPIDISCISINNYIDTVKSLTKKMKKCGFTKLKSENNYIKFTNGLDIYLVEIVKIRNNMLYYLFLKN